MKNYPRGISKNEFDMFVPELAPPDAMLKVFKEKSVKFKAASHGMRGWGKSNEERKNTAVFKAFVFAYGPDAVYYRRHLRNDKKASEVISKIRDLLHRKYIVVLIGSNDKIPDYRFILMQTILRESSMSKIFDKHHYKQIYHDFATYVQGRQRKLPRREA